MQTRHPFERSLRLRFPDLSVYCTRWFAVYARLCAYLPQQFYLIAHQFYRKSLKKPHFARDAVAARIEAQDSAEAGGSVLRICSVVVGGVGLERLYARGEGADDKGAALARSRDARRERRVGAVCKTAGSGGSAAYSGDAAK